MSENILISIVLLSPLLFFIIAVSSFFTSKISISLMKKMSNFGGLFYLIISIFAAILVYKQGLIQSNLIGFYQLGFSFRLDALAVCMFIMVAFLSYIIIKFSNNYLDGDIRQGLFFGRLAATIAAVQLFIISGNIAALFISWVLTSIFLNKLLIYYPDRILAKIAAHKKFIVARIADVALLIALIFIYHAFGTGNLEAIFTQIE
jgi:NAD(P)H-quinone oxidoreductase subunit 5